MRWFPICRDDGAKVAGFCTHTVSESIVGGKKRYSVWRLIGRKPGQAVSLGVFDSDQQALSAVENDGHKEEEAA